MSRYQNTYIYRTFELEFPATSRRTHQTLGDHWTQVSDAFWSNWTGKGARGERREASQPIVEAGGWSEELLAAGQGRNEEATITHPTSPPCHVRRVKPHRKWCLIAWPMPDSSAPPSHRPRLSRPRLDQRPRLDRQYPFVLVKSKPHIEESTAESDPLYRGPMSWDRGPGPWYRGPIP
jgi:hypothetical protein